MGLTLVTGPTIDPVSLAEAKAQCRGTADEEDGLLAGYILAARQHAESYLSRALLAQTWDFTIDRDWPWTIDHETDRHVRMIELPKAPLQSVTSVTYVDDGGNTQTLATSEYVVDIGTYIGRIYPAYGVCWPSVRCQPKAVTVRFVAGYGSNPGDIPEPIRQAMLLLVAHWYDNREAAVSASLSEIPYSVEALLAPYRVFY